MLARCACFGLGWAYFFIVFWLGLHGEGHADAHECHNDFLHSVDGFVFKGLLIGVAFENVLFI